MLYLVLLLFPILFNQVCPFLDLLPFWLGTWRSTFVGNWSEYITCQLLFTLPDQDESDLLHVECGCSLYMCDYWKFWWRAENCVFLHYRQPTAVGRVHKFVVIHFQTSTYCNFCCKKVCTLPLLLCSCLLWRSCWWFVLLPPNAVYLLWTAVFIVYAMSVMFTLVM